MERERSEGRGLKVAMAVTPIVAMATIALGLHVGGRWTIHAATLEAAPHARGSSAYAWQVTTLIDDRGVRETEARRGVHVRARAANGREASWIGDTNEDGVGEVRLDLPGVERGDPIDVEVTAEREGAPLAVGRIPWNDAAWRSAAPGPFARASKREGVLAIDVAARGERLVDRLGTPLSVRVTSRDDGHPIGGVTVMAEPEPGLELATTTATTCANGWARLTASPVLFAASLSLHARASDGRAGEWAGDLPVAPGGMVATILQGAKGEPTRVRVEATSPRVAYVEVDDEVGRAFASATRLTSEGGNARVTLDVGALSPGLAWVVTSSDPRGAEGPTGSTLAYPFVVEGDPRPPGAPPPNDACAEEAYLALHPAGGFQRWTALDGFPAREAENMARRKRGLSIALTSLAVASLLEVILLVQASRRGRAGARRGRDAVSVVTVILLGVLGFGLMAALLVSRA